MKRRKAKRGEIIDEKLLDEFRRTLRCGWCQRPQIHGCHPHHLLGRGMGGCRRLDVRINLIALCVEDHAAVHAGRIEMSALLMIVAKREKRLQDDILDELYRHRRV
jgi:hypothetical protein